MARFRALRDLQAPSLGLVRAGFGSASEFSWVGNIIGWHVEPLDEEAQAMIDERAKVLAARGEKGPGGVGDKPLPTQPFPKGVMKASAGMSAPAIVNESFAALPPSERSEGADAPRRRAAKG